MNYVKKGEKGDLLLLEAPDGRSAYFEFLEMAVVDGVEYAALLEEGDDEPTVLRFLEAMPGRPEQYAEIEDETAFEAACGALFGLLDADE